MTNIKPLTEQNGEVRELTDNEVAKMQPLQKLDPTLYAKIKRGVGQRGKQKKPTKELVSLRLSSDVSAYFRATGQGWQGRIDKILKDYINHLTG